MQAENWQTVKEILHDVLQIEPSQRQGFLERKATTDEIRLEVESLLAYDKDSANFMSLPITDFSGYFASGGDAEISLVGQRIGIYEIEREIGFGGMGAVYLAERRDGKFEQKVAIKMLKREFNTERIRRYFRREREIQAKLNHPNIARLLDAGTTGDGVPFLVMEYIDGLPIDKFCETNNLSLNSRLKLFNRACDAVMHAHRNLTVHLDLKPSNILVTPSGEPKLLDFGISKLLGGEKAENKQTTLLGAMTPEYASPEQIRGEPVTTATDIYSLGVVLYKILTASLPFRLNGKTNGELLETITHGKPILPSAALSEPGAAATGFPLTDDKNPVATAPGSDISPFQLKGDLDNIILKSLRKEPERRYQTVEQFTADIWRHIDGLPVLARPATSLYRASKFYERNKVQVLAGAFIIFSLIAGIAVALWQANTAQAQAQIAAGARAAAEVETEKAKSEEEKAEKISRFMSKVISYANPSWYAEGGRFKGEVKLIDVMDDLGGKIDIEFALQPDIQSELHHKFAEVYNFYPTAERRAAREKELYHARRALEFRKQYYGEHHELVAKDLFYLTGAGAVENGEVNDENIAKTLAKAIQMMRETNPLNLNLPYMLDSYAHNLSVSYDLDKKAEKYYFHLMPRPDHEKRQETYRREALPPTDEDKYQLAERYCKEALPIFRLHYKDEGNVAIVSTQCNLAFVLLKQKKQVEFEHHYQICLQGADKIDAEFRRKHFSDFEELLAKGATLR